MYLSISQQVGTFQELSNYLSRKGDPVNKIRPMLPGDVDTVIEVHKDAFHGFFLTFLGPAFLREFYTGVCADPSGIAIVSGEGSIAGFVVGTTEPSGFYKRLIQKRWWKFALASVKPVIEKPVIVPRLLRALTLPSKTATPDVKMGTLMSLGVSKEFHGNGIGKYLVCSFLEKSRQRDVEIVNLLTDAIDNDSTNEFYRKMGFTLVKVFMTPEGRLMNEYAIRLS
jgi:ribosomal protein S18 acetylase RimI-like enzyme